MARLGRSPFYALSLLVGSLLFGIAGLMHPLLVGDGAAQLATIAGTPAWRAIHWSLLFGFPLMLVGVLGIAGRHLETAGASAARSGALMAVFGFAAWMLNVLFMTGAGWNLARAYTASDLGLSGTHAVLLYDMLHPAGLAAERVGTFATGIALYLLGRAIVKGGEFPGWLGWLGLAAGLVSIGVAVVRSEFSLTMFYAQALIVAWLAVAAVVMLLERPASTP